MPFPQDDPNAEGAKTGPSPVAQSMEEALEQIDRILHQMLLLSELSAGDNPVDRGTLQKALERLQNKIDRIAEQL